MEENITAVKILGEEFRISCPPEEKEQVINAAAFLDSKLREMKKSSNLEENKITILTALRITDEYLKSKASKDASEEAMNLSKNLTAAVDKLAKKVKTQKEILSKI